MISNFEPAWDNPSLDVCTNIEALSVFFDRDSQKSNNDRKDSVRSLIEKYDLLYKSPVPAKKGKVHNLGSLGKYFGCEFMDSKVVRQEFLNLYKKDDFSGQLSAEESQTSTPIQRVSVYEDEDHFVSSEKTEGLNLAKSKGKNVKKSVNIKKCPEGLRLLQSSHSFSPALIQDSHSKSIQSNGLSSLYKIGSFNSSPDPRKSSKDNCTKHSKPSPQVKSLKKSKLDSSHSTISLFQQSFNDLSNIKSAKHPIAGSTRPTTFQNYLVQSPDTKHSKPFDISNSKSKSPTNQLHPSSPLNPSNPAKSKKTCQTFSSISLSPKSTKVLIEKFTKEFNSILPESLQELSYLHFLKVLKGMKMMSEVSPSKDAEKLLAVQMWESLSQQGKLMRSTLLLNLIAIMKLRPSSSNSNHMQVDSSKQNQKYFLFYSNRISSNQMQLSKSSPSSPVYSFQPKINPNSTLLASTNSTESTRTERLYEKIHPSHKTLMAREIKQKTQEEECTFSPKINKFHLKHQIEENFSGKIKDEYKKLKYKGLNKTQALIGLALKVKSTNVKRKNDFENKEAGSKNNFDLVEDKELNLGINGDINEENKDSCNFEDLNVEKIEFCYDETKSVELNLKEEDIGMLLEKIEGGNRLD